MLGRRGGSVYSALLLSRIATYVVSVHKMRALPVLRGVCQACRVGPCNVPDVGRLGGGVPCTRVRKLRVRQMRSCLIRIFRITASRRRSRRVCSSPLCVRRRPTGGFEVGVRLGSSRPLI